MQFLHHYERYAWIVMFTLFIMVYALGGHAGAFHNALFISLSFLCFMDYRSNNSCHELFGNVMVLACGSCRLGVNTVNTL